MPERIEARQIEVGDVIEHDWAKGRFTAETVSGSAGEIVCVTGHADDGRAVDLRILADMHVERHATGTGVTPTVTASVTPAVTTAPDPEDSPDVPAERLLPVAFYGTLMDGQPAKPGRPQFEQFGSYVGDCLIPGQMQDAGDHPRLIQWRGRVRGQLWKPHSKMMYRTLDTWVQASTSETVERRMILLREPQIDAYVYVYERDPALPIIEGGDWTHRQVRREAA